MLICRLVVPPLTGSVAVPKVQADSGGRFVQDSCTGGRDPVRATAVTYRFTACPVITVGVPVTVSENALDSADDEVLTTSSSGVDELAAVAVSPAYLAEIA